MKDHDIKSLFTNFEPELPNADDFMARLSRNLDAVEMVKQHNAAFKRLNRRAALIAAITGFAVGVLFTLALPYITSFLSKVEMPNVQIMFLDLKEIASLLTWAFIGTATILTATNTHETSLKLMKADNGNPA